MVNCRRNIAVFVGVVCLAEICLSLSVLTLQSNETLLEVEHGWGAWGKWEPCSRSCGGGVTFMQRSCLFTRSNGLPDCIGQSRKYSSCFIQDCPDGSIDFRSEQCSNFNNRSFDGRRHTWRPYVGSSVSNPCELHCQPEEESFFMKLADKVVDGTRCDDVSFNVCVDGACQALQNSCIGHFLGYFYPNFCETGGIFAASLDLYFERFLYRSWGECSQPCIGGVKTRDVRCVQGERLIIDDVHCSNVTAKPANQEACMEMPCPDWTVGTWSECSAECGKGMQKRRVVCSVLHNDENEEVSAHLCNGEKPPTVQHCSNSACEASWFSGSWTRCTSSCGEGRHTRHVMCLSEVTYLPVRDEDCDETGKPHVVEPCNLGSCPGMSRGHINYIHSLSRIFKSIFPGTSIIDCHVTEFGCCPDNKTPSSGEDMQGCPRRGQTCRNTRYGCCKNGYHAATGPNHYGCAEYALRRSKPDLCSLPPTRGPCFGRFERWFYDQLDHSCKSFAFGGCAGNENNFRNRKLCENVCK
uniref:BPTI/Kunitz inhibitor domain-containing protein n=1 Tax=Ciona intestinalis TaxID=7719 RepID=H2XS44_CIOIN